MLSFYAYQTHAWKGLLHQTSPPQYNYSFPPVCFPYARVHSNCYNLELSFHSFLLTCQVALSLVPGVFSVLVRILEMTGPEHTVSLLSTSQSEMNQKCPQMTSI